MSAAPGVRHRRASFRLHVLLDTAARAAGAPVEVLEAVSVLLPSGLVVPGLVVTDAGAAVEDTVGIDADAVQLVVGPVSPGNRTMDRKVKPLLYAEAAVPYFWRLEFGPAPRLVTSTLESGRTWRPRPRSRGPPHASGPRSPSASAPPASSGSGPGVPGRGACPGSGFPARPAAFGQSEPRAEPAAGSCRSCERMPVVAVIACLYAPRLDVRSGSRYLLCPRSRAWDGGQGVPRSGTGRGTLQSVECVSCRNGVRGMPLSGIGSRNSLRDFNAEALSVAYGEPGSQDLGRITSGHSPAERQDLPNTRMRVALTGVPKLVNIGNRAHSLGKPSPSVKAWASPGESAVFARQGITCRAGRKIDRATLRKFNRDFNAEALSVAYGEPGSQALGAITSGHSPAEWRDLPDRGMQVTLTGVRKPVNIGERAFSLRKLPGSGRERASAGESAVFTRQGITCPAGGRIDRATLRSAGEASRSRGGLSAGTGPEALYDVPASAVVAAGGTDSALSEESPPVGDPPGYADYRELFGIAELPEGFGEGWGDDPPYPGHVIDVPGPGPGPVSGGVGGLRSEAAVAVGPFSVAAAARVPGAGVVGGRSEVSGPGEVPRYGESGRQSFGGAAAPRTRGRQG
ncbi:Uma2 family endonuclease (plasmid) [Streptomyces globisporus]|nr:Uma2 family endonuclease [Streptomyces globisporus]